MAPFSEGHSQPVRSAANDILLSYWPDSELPLPLHFFSPPCKHAGSHSINAPPPPCKTVPPEDVNLLFLSLATALYFFFPLNLSGDVEHPRWGWDRVGLNPTPVWRSPCDKHHALQQLYCPLPSSPHISPPLPWFSSQLTILCSLCRSSPLFWEQVGCLVSSVMEKI